MKEKITLKLFKFLKPFWKYYKVVLVLIFAMQGLSLLAPYLLACIIDAPNLKSAFGYIGMSFGVWFLIQCVLTIIRNRYETKNITFDTDVFLNNFSLQTLLGLSVGQHRSQHSGVKQYTMTQGQNAIDQIVSESLFEITPILVQTIITIALITVISPLIGIWVIGLIALYAYLTVRRNLGYRSRIMDWLEEDKKQSKMQAEVHRNIDFIILEAQEHKAAEMVKESQVITNTMAKNIWIPYVTQSGLLRIIIGVARYGGIAIAVYLIFNGQFSKGMFVAFVSWIQQSVGNIEMITQKQRRFMVLFGRVRKYLEMLEIKTDVPISPKARKITNFKGKIEFRNVSHSYPKRNDKAKNGSKEDSAENADTDRDSIKQIQFTIMPHEKIGIVGESGAGKSTLVNLLRRSFDPKQGQILIDDVPLKDLDLSWYRRNLGNVEQNVSVLDLTIRENILFGLNGDAHRVTDDELKKVTTMASIDGFIENLSDGYDTMVGEKGIKLSGGESQRIAIARALIKDPKILIFDEATSALDAHNEKIVHDAMKKMSVGRTTIIIAHRLSTVVDADRIIVMKKGTIDDVGTHAQLQERCAEYQKLIKNQVVAF